MTRAPRKTLAQYLSGPPTLTQAEWNWLRSRLLVVGADWSHYHRPTARRIAAIVAKADAVCGPLNPNGYSAESHQKLFAALAALDAETPKVEP